MLFKIESPRLFCAHIKFLTRREIAWISIIEIRRAAIDALQKLAILNLTGPDQSYGNLSAKMPRIDPRSQLICDQIIESNEVVTARSGELSLPSILHLPLRKKKRKKEAEEEEETGHVFGWLSGEIRDRKHLGGGGEGAALFVRALYSMELSSGVLLVYGVTRAKRARNRATISTRRNAITPISSLISRDKGTCRACLSCTLSLSRAHSLDCLAMEGASLFDKSSV